MAHLVTPVIVRWPLYKLSLLYKEDMADFWDQRDVQQLPPIHLQSLERYEEYMAIGNFVEHAKKEPGVTAKDLTDFALMQPLAIFDAIDKGWAEVGPAEENPM